MSMRPYDEAGDDESVMSEINMTPLVDVMLVLLIIFIVTIPVINDAIRVQLPHASNVPNEAKAEHINVVIDEAGQLYWNSELLNWDAMSAHMADAAQRDQRPELHVRADRHTTYETVAKVLAAAQRAGLVKVNLVTEPD